MCMCMCMCELCVMCGWPDFGGVEDFTDALLLKCEFVLLEHLQFDLVVFHPYRPLQLYATPLLTCLGHLPDVAC